MEEAEKMMAAEAEAVHSSMISILPPSVAAAGLCPSAQGQACIVLVHQVMVEALLPPFPTDSRSQDDLKAARHAMPYMAQGKVVPSAGFFFFV